MRKIFLTVSILIIVSCVYSGEVKEKPIDREHAERIIELACIARGEEYHDLKTKLIKSYPDVSAFLKSIIDKQIEKYEEDTASDLYWLRRNVAQVCLLQIESPKKYEEMENNLCKVLGHVSFMHYWIRSHESKRFKKIYEWVDFEIPFLIEVLIHRECFMYGVYSRKEEYKDDKKEESWVLPDGSERGIIYPGFIRGWRGYFDPDFEEIRNNKYNFKVKPFTPKFHDTAKYVARLFAAYGLAYVRNELHEKIKNKKVSKMLEGLKIKEKDIEQYTEPAFKALVYAIKSNDHPRIEAGILGLGMYKDKKVLKPLAYYIEKRQEEHSFLYLKEAQTSFTALSDKEAISQLAEIPLEAASKELGKFIKEEWIFTLLTERMIEGDKEAAKAIIQHAPEKAKRYFDEFLKAETFLKLNQARGLLNSIYKQCVWTENNSKRLESIEIEKSVFIDNAIIIIGLPINHKVKWKEGYIEKLKKSKMRAIIEGYRKIDLTEIINFDVKG